MHALKRSCSTSTSKCPRPRHLAACLTATLGLTGLADNAIAATITVNDCTESGLDLAITGANADSSVDTIDMSGLACSTIPLTGSMPTISSTKMTLLGPTGHTLTIDAALAGSGGLLNHTGHGTLTVSHLALANGSHKGIGGCIYSVGVVDLTHSTITGCSAGQGGGVYSNYGVALHYSSITSNSALQGGGVKVEPARTTGYVLAYSSTITANTADYGSGGGILANNVVMTDSVVSGNRAYYKSMHLGNGGGIFGNSIVLTGTTVSGNYALVSGGGIYGTTVQLNHSTVTGNSSESVGGGISAIGSVTLVQSTIDNNTAHNVGAIYTNNFSATNSTISDNYQFEGANVSCNNLTLMNSTVAFNHSINATAGIFVAVSAQITSSIVARNNVAISSDADDLAIATGAPVTASANLIMSSNLDTGSLTSDPQLTPLAFHGGPTRTHALQATSPAVNAGNADGLTTDQRGSGFNRVVGTNADIGAYERQLHDDEIFYGGFE